MAQISPIGSLPDPITNVPSGAVKNASSATPLKAPQKGSDETQASPLQAQLTHFSSVLASLQNTAATTRGQYVQAYNQVRTGAYSINPLEVSKSIVSDSLTQQ